MKTRLFGFFFLRDLESMLITPCTSMMLQHAQSTDKVSVIYDAYDSHGTWTDTSVFPILPTVSRRRWDVK